MGFWVLPVLTGSSRFSTNWLLICVGFSGFKGNLTRIIRILNNFSKITEWKWIFIGARKPQKEGYLQLIVIIHIFFCHIFRKILSSQRPTSLQKMNHVRHPVNRLWICGFVVKSTKKCPRVVGEHSKVCSFNLGSSICLSWKLRTIREERIKKSDKRPTFWLGNCWIFLVGG